MLAPTPLKHAPRYPVTASVAAAVLAVTGAWWSGRSIDGLFMSGKGALKWTSIAGLTAVMALCLLGSTVLWPWVSLSDYAEAEVKQTGLEAMDRNDYPGAVKLLEIAVRMRRAPARAWYSLGVAYETVSRYDESYASFSHAAGMPDATSDMQETAREMKSYLARKKPILDEQGGF